MIDTDAIRTHLAACTDTDAATAYVTALPLTAPALRSLAADLRVSVPGRASKAETVRMIVRFTVGVRLNSRTISRPSFAR